MSGDNEGIPGEKGLGDVGSENYSLAGNGGEILVAREEELTCWNVVHGSTKLPS